MDNEQKKNEQELTGSEVNVPGSEVTKRKLDQPETQPVFDIDESDMVTAQPEPNPQTVSFTDADPKSVQQETVSAGRPVNVHNVTEEERPSPTERAAQSARTQANAAADAFRRGEFMRDATVDGAANGDDRLIALLSYATQILIPFVMPALVLFSESSKKRPFQRFHAVQSLALTTVLIVLGIFVAVGTAVISIIPVIGWLAALIVGCLSPIAVLMAWFAMVYYGYQAYQGKRFAIPGLTSFLKDQGWI
jgi:uncharacterized membrane protein